MPGEWKSQTVGSNMIMSFLEAHDENLAGQADEDRPCNAADLEPGFFCSSTSQSPLSPHSATPIPNVWARSPFLTCPCPRVYARNYWCSIRGPIALKDHIYE